MRSVIGGILLGLVVAQAAAAETQHLSTRSLAAAVGANERGTVAVAYQTRRGVELRVARRGRAFGRAVVAASRAEGGSRAREISVAVGEDGRVLIAWIVNDRSHPAPPSARAEDCCDRLHAVSVDRRGRAGTPHLLSPPDVHALLGPIAVGPDTLAASWTWGGVAIPVTDPGGWQLRVADADGRWGPAQTLIASSRMDFGSARAEAGSLAVVGGRLVAIGGVSAGTSMSLGMLAADASGVFRPLGASVSMPVGLVGTRFAIDRLGRPVGFVEASVDLGQRDRLVVGDRAGRLQVSDAGTRGFESTQLVTDGSGAAALIEAPQLGEGGRRGRVRRRRSGGGFGPWRPLSVSQRPVIGFLVVGAVDRRGRVAIFTADGYRQDETRILLNRVSGNGRVRGLRRLRTYRGDARTVGAAFDGRGRPVVVVSAGLRLDAIAP